LKFPASSARTQKQQKALHRVVCSVDEAFQEAKDSQRWSKHLSRTMQPGVNKIALPQRKGNKSKIQKMNGSQAG